jgi:hypothetical protein
MVASCSGDETTPGTAGATVASSASASASSHGVGGSGGGGGSDNGGQGGVGGCMVAVGGCYDAFDCTPWASCECPDLPCGADCNAYRQCVAACTDNPCIDDCGTQHTMGADEHAAIVACAHCGADRCLGSLCNDAYPAVTCP